MSAALLSGHWFRLAALRPSLRGHARIHRHVYRGKLWYVIHDRISGNHHRFNAPAYEVIRQLDGRHTMQEIWDQLVGRFHDDSPTQSEIVQVLGQLNAADLLLIDATPDVAELIDRRGLQRKRKLMGRFLNPMSLRFPLWDPDRFLTIAGTWIRPMPPLLLMALWLACVVPALLMAPAQWPELTRNFTEQLLSAGNLWVMAIAFPVLKLAHELAHGFAIKRGGGEVHEMGVMFLMFYPIPYVDASSAHAFPSKARRVWVGAAGMAAELAIAAIAFYVWMLVEPGLLRSVAYNVVVLGSITTVLFNANPLLRYDGYYILSDLVEIPNLGQRATQYWQYLATRYLFGIRSTQAAWASPAERRWFFWYAPVAFVYRMLVTIGIAWFIAQRYFVFGLLLAVWSVATSLLLPICKALKSLFTDARFIARAGRVWLTLGSAVVVVAALLFIVPMPYHTRAEGVVWLPEKALLRAGADGFVGRVQARSGDRITAGQAVVETSNPQLAAQIAEQEAKLDETQVRLDAAWGSKPAEAGRLAEAVARETATLNRAQDEQAQLVARPQADGRLLIDRAQDLPGRFLRKGDLIGYVVGPHAPIVRLVVTQADVDRVRSDLRHVEVRIVGDMAHPLQATLTRAVPKAARELPSPALGLGGGGRNVVDPRDEKQMTAMDMLFEFELVLPADASAEHLGQRAYVSFEHAPEAVGWRWLRAARRQLLSKMEV